MGFKKTISCDYLAEILGWNISQDEKLKISSELNILGEKIYKLSPYRQDLKETLFRFVERSHDGYQVFPDEFADSPFSYEGRRLSNNVETLKKYGICEFDKDIDDNDIIIFCGCDHWKDIKMFCEKTEIPLRHIIMDLNFAVFDSEENIEKEPI